ncbi:MAG: excinuclease ABC subunit UvrC [Caldisericia bacterium]|nr:excinuclease ABC subunit UvrC [Caldisericia bacterium]
MDIKNTSNDIKEALRESVRSFPDSPGVYVMRNANDEVLYVGKATSLRKRVTSYFYNKKKFPRIRDMMNLVATIDFITTESPYEALILECNFIKRLLPAFNRALKDDKGYQYLKFTNHEYPALLKVMKMKNDGAQYFGPYTSSKKASYLHRLLLTTFHLRNCRKNLKSKNQKSCLRYHMGQCTGVCINKTSKEDYSERVNLATQFLKNNYHSVRNTLKKDMLKASSEKRYEYAALLRDQIKSIDTISNRQRVVMDQSFNGDFIAIFSINQRAVIDILKVRMGKVVYEDHFFIYNTFGEDQNGILQNFIIQYYIDLSFFSPPNSILLNIEISDSDKIQRLIKEKFNLHSTFSIKTPVKGKKKSLTKLSFENAKKHFEVKFPEYIDSLNPILVEMQKQFSLTSIPFRIEGYDISHIQGVDTVGSMVVFINGKPAKKYYRYFKVRLESLPDDTGSIKEVIERRIKHTDEAFGALPDVFLIDGGLGQLHAASSVLMDNDVLIPVLSLAKKEELVYSQKSNAPIRLNQEKSQVLRLLQQVRDESHRFAKKQFTKQHIKSTLYK